MATVAEFTVDGEVFPLGSVFEELPDARVELERVVPANDGVIPYFWLDGAEVDDVVARFADHPGVRDVREVDRFDGQYLMRCEWVREYTGVLAGLTETEVALLSAVGTAEQWCFEVRGEDREAIAEFREFCLEYDVPIDVQSLHSLEPLETDYGLTDAQREALLVAHERGYFDSPRRATLAEVGEELGISQQALGARLRRATRRLVDDALLET